MFCAICGATVNEGTAFCPGCGSRMQTGAVPAQPQPFSAAPAPPVAYAPAMDYATWGNRALGYIIDSVLVGVVMGVLWAILAGALIGLAGPRGGHFGGGICCSFIILFPLSTLLVGLYNRVYLVSQRGYSIGQGVVKVKVVDANGQLLTQGTAFVRLLAQAGMGLVPFLPLLDLLWPLWDVRRQTLHDKAVNCYVITNPQA
jgi:uncharacterized RDD family membrane protein YckC